MNRNKTTMILLLTATTLALAPMGAQAHNIADFNHESAAETVNGDAHALPPACVNVRVVLCDSVASVSVTGASKEQASADLVFQDERSSGSHYLEGWLEGSYEHYDSPAKVDYAGKKTTDWPDALHAWNLISCQSVCTGSTVTKIHAATDIDSQVNSYTQHFINICDVCIRPDPSYLVSDPSEDSALVEVTLDQIELTDPSGSDVLTDGGDLKNTVQVDGSGSNTRFTSSGGHPLFVEYDETLKAWKIYEYR